MLREMTWKQAVMDQVLALVNETGSPEFTLGQLYEREPYFRALFPRNHRVRAKVRQILQFLRDDGLLMFQEPGHYALNIESPHITEETDSPLPGGRDVPGVREARRLIRMRDTCLGLALKELYRYRCQACGQSVPLSEADYAESHHLRPVASPHEGPDRPGNVIVLCPNHHVMFDRGAASVEPQTLRLVHARAGVTFPHARVHLKRPHRLAKTHLAYHFRNIFRG